ncbi:hypothetical protein [Kribbella catacumbae]|uniref:hypothetical protein n=1 Tax=Kribbella catacumbae TaxID=460086 RepID=UPI00037480C1|nr:hypothetical protein [Kribbella catacumbae]
MRRVEEARRQQVLTAGQLERLPGQHEGAGLDEQVLAVGGLQQAGRLQPDGCGVSLIELLGGRITPLLEGAQRSAGLGDPARHLGRDAGRRALPLRRASRLAPAAQNEGEKENEADQAADPHPDVRRQVHLLGGRTRGPRRPLRVQVARGDRRQCAAVVRRTGLLDRADDLRRGPVPDDPGVQLVVELHSDERAALQPGGADQLLRAGPIVVGGDQDQVQARLAETSVQQGRHVQVLLAEVRRPREQRDVDREARSTGRGPDPVQLGLGKARPHRGIDVQPVLAPGGGDLVGQLGLGGRGGLGGCQRQERQYGEQHGQAAAQQVCEGGGHRGQPTTSRVVHLSTDVVGAKLVPM